MSSIFVPNFSLATPASKPKPSPRVIAETQLLSDLLLDAFGPNSQEAAIHNELASLTFSPDWTTPTHLGLCASYSAIRTFLKNDHLLLGGGYSSFEIAPLKGDGGREVLAACVRTAQAEIHSLISRSNAQIQEGDYSSAKETARGSMIVALVRLGEMPHDHKRRGSSSRVVLDAAEEGSVFELPHLSPSLRPTEEDLNSASLDLSPPFLLTPSNSCPSSPLARPALSASDLELASFNFNLNGPSGSTGLGVMGGGGLPPVSPTKARSGSRSLAASPSGRMIPRIREIIEEFEGI